jgi:predicted phosphodiesterase
MKIQLVSDLHLEFSDITIKNNGADVLILGGDILIVSKLIKPNSEYGIRYRDFLKRVSDEFPHVIYVMGNHEFYDSGSFFKGVDQLREHCDQYTNLYLLEQNTKIINDIVFVGGTLWTNMNKNDPITMHAVRDMMNDYRAIRNDQNNYIPIKPHDTVQRHNRTVEYIKLVLSEHKEQTCVVVGHHSPSYKSCPEEFLRDFLMNGAYHSDLTDIMLDNPQIKLWTHGHTHTAFDYSIGDTRIVCNPRGYHSDRGWGEETGWDPNKIFEV